LCRESLILLYSDCCFFLARFFSKFEEGKTISLVKEKKESKKIKSINMDGVGDHPVMRFKNQFHSRSEEEKGRIKAQTQETEKKNEKKKRMMVSLVVCLSPPKFE
jgi:hypothetical protein